MSGMWKRSHGRTSEAPPDERGGYRYVRPTATASHLDSTLLSHFQMRSFTPRPTTNRLSTQLRPRAVASANYQFLSGGAASAVCPIYEVQVLHQRYGAFYAFDVIILLSSARIGISSKSSALRRVQSMPVGASLTSSRGRAPQPSRSIRIHRNARCEPRRCTAASPFSYRRPDCAAASRSLIRAVFRPTRCHGPCSIAPGVGQARRHHPALHPASGWPRLLEPAAGRGDLARAAIR
jgi:hypothetical protein